ncbi:uncharacterized protein si:ch211-13c6.2 isoform X2 [Electrophorus electricus]|uniref:C2H2-type domain-containing protein n=2 Tax=Electrophorus TaxID=8004 RepID=A0AAY5EPB4_ELEEL|nr:uncharacterized protein si:ch211-13c6.2 isoform X2 [Electrophorus electricus]
MADLLTVYDDDEANTFIDCTICEKRLRGDTQYKVHLTTLKHFKREEGLASNGLIPKPPPLPEWTDIKQYLKYLDLDEPIIGLSALVQEEDSVSDDGKVLLRYRCRMCAVEMDLYSMATHVVGLKHRQKYLELKRPDLVTWQNNSQKQPGLVARAKAAVVEKQEGWGTPVPLSRPKEVRSLRKDNQGYRTTEICWSDTHEMPYPGQDRREKPPPAEVACRSYLEDDTLGRHSRYREDNTYDGSYRANITHLRFHPEDDRCEIPYSKNGRQRSYRDDSHTESIYLKEDNNLRSYTEDSGRSYVDKPATSSNYECWDECYREVSPNRRQFTSRDAQEDFYHGNVPKKQSTDIDLRVSGAARHPVEMDLDQENEQMYTSHEGRGSGMDEMERPDRNLQYAGKEWENFQTVERTRVGYFEVQTHPQRARDAVANYPQESVPAKRKRKSRFSDATPLEMALAQKGQIEDLLRKTKKRGVIIPTNLEDIQIENDEEANFLKEKLCTLLKEFQANKAQRTEQKNQASHSTRDYNYMSDARVEQRRERPEARHFEARGHLEPARYHESARDYQDSRSCKDNATNMRETWQFEEHPRAFQDRRHVQDIRRYGKDTLPEFTRHERDPREQDSRHFEDGVSRQGFEHSPRDFQLAGHVKESRSIKNARHTRGTEEAISYAKYERVTLEPRHHITEGVRRAAEERYCGGEFRPSQHSFEWDPNRGGSAERSEDVKSYLPDNERRGYRRVSLWDSKSLMEEEKVRADSQTTRARYQRGGDLYDPFHPSSSPPKEVANSSSLEKLASTLLELMARNSN